MRIFLDCGSTINEVDVSNDGQNTVNGVNTLYENNQFAFGGNQNENNFAVNSEVYQKEFQADATFCAWDYVDDRPDALYNNNYAEHDIRNNVLHQIAYERNDIENFENNRHYELQVGIGVS
ncbi:2444_t:CDS:2 [Scutellospora calospora]|uniref:2444_t:CDS:1 n=1 Tax=Scutellospora calospora TaxID=85575 RepID=A0ACA9L0T5_9GLOM|nr:2444_t:CDS:2 [Scutellospora calospora]